MLWITLGSFFAFTGLVGLGTYLLTHNDDHSSSVGYFLAGRRLTATLIAGSLMLTNLSTEQLVGLNGAAFSDGLSVIAWEVLAGFSLVVMGLFFLPRYLKAGITTIPEFLELRYDHTTRAITSLIFIAAYTLILLPILLYSGAVGLTGILNVRELLGLSAQSDTALLWGTVWLIGIIGSIYAIFGGLRSVAVSDTLNGFGLLVGGLLITWLGLQKVGGEAGAWVGLKMLHQQHPEKFHAIGGPEQSVPFTTLFTGVIIINLFYWCTNQQIIQRALAAKNLAEGQRGVLLASFLKILAPLILVLPGIVSFHLYSEQITQQDQAYGTLVRNVLPAPLAGFFAAVVIGAVLSSFNSALNSTATLFSLGVYKNLLHPQATELQVIRAGKRFGWLIAVAAMTGAPLLAGQTSLFSYLQKMNALYFIPIFAVVLTGMLHRRVPAAAANMALIVGCLAIGLGYFVPALSRNVVEPMHEFHFVGAVFVLLVVLMIAWAVLRPRKEPFELVDSGQVDGTPWRYATPAGCLLVGTIVGIYALFA